MRKDTVWGRFGHSRGPQQTVQPLFHCARDFCHFIDESGRNISDWESCNGAFVDAETPYGSNGKEFAEKER